MSDLLDYQYMLDSLPAILKGVPVSLTIALIAFVVGLIIALACALIRIYNVPVLKQLVVLFVSFVRGTPLLVQIFLSYYGIPIVIRALNESYGLNWDISFIPAIYFIYVAFSINSGAYLSETIRAAILSVDKGQFEACYSVGMTTSQALRRVIFPQALRVGLPNLCNHFIILLKDTSLAFAASVPEILGEAKMIAGRTSQFFEVYIVAALIYWVLCTILEQISMYLERRLNKKNGGI
ncbi:amino acid ABC transporter permease [Kurthia senegalensis]|uniref:amino acid ABC transporter permease n=1 Tax=Kurthia senegalensis TaxID=1033740 RepID=UPI0002895AEE|nr:amino acid ABC transporter permease [Kurthia senegalensis]